MTEIIYIPNIENYTMEIIDGELILTPKKNITQIQIEENKFPDIESEYKSINENGMNLFEVVTDLSNAIGIDLFKEKGIDNYLKSLLGDLPKHCNLYFAITYMYKKKVPKWFVHKYTEVNIEKYRYHGWIED